MSRYARWVIFPAQVAEIWTEERRKIEGPNAPAVEVFRVHDCLRWSKPGKTTPNRYQDHPVPYPRESPHPKQAVWSGLQEQDLRDWWHDREKPTKNADPDAMAARRVAGERRLNDWRRDVCGVAGTVNHDLDDE